MSREQELNQTKRQLDLEVDLNTQLTNHVILLKQSIAQLQSQSEMEQEYISNTLLRKIELLNKEKSDLLIKVEQEEDMLVNRLTQKLNVLQQEKVQLELALEKEQEYMVNRLQKQLDDLSPHRFKSTHFYDTVAPSVLQLVNEALKKTCSDFQQQAQQHFLELNKLYHQALQGSKDLPPDLPSFVS
ncbi:hypothetical protein EDD86DRAFT_245214 [Gorgonomyces haynaldii]|nr:hypothetical protein EDD86DRAFT_245214 [Gorgonomyces haynaldii]